MMASDPDPSEQKKRRTRKKPESITAIVGSLIASRGFRFEHPEAPEERRSRLKVEEERARHELWRDKALLVSCLIASAVVGLVAIALLSVPGQPPETRTWAAATLSAIVSAVVGYASGRAGRSP